jgi:hypothetical protein
LSTPIEVSPALIREMVALPHAGGAREPVYVFLAPALEHERLGVAPQNFAQVYSRIPHTEYGNRRAIPSAVRKGLRIVPDTV